MKDKLKSRNLSFYQYLEQLQLEYIVAELRRKIYVSIKDHEFYRKVMEKKKRVIEDIALRNNLQTIFTDKWKREEKYREVYKHIGFPNFMYRDENEKNLLYSKDLKFYYMINAEFRVSLPNGEEKIGKLKHISFTTSTAEVELNEMVGQITLFDINFLTRIL